MIKSADLGIDPVRYSPGRLSIAATVAASVLGWLLALSGLISTIAALPELGWERALWTAALCGAPPTALWMTRRAVAERRIRAAVPLPLLEQRCHGRLEAITDSERRSLRPIASTAYEVAARTGELLADLAAIPSMRIFCGVRAAGTDLPLIPHAISAGQQVVFIESVAWPAGRYETTQDGQIHCDGHYIGQSVRPFIDAVRYWRKFLPKGNNVSGVIVVHCAADGDLRLPSGTADDLAWVRAEDALREIRQRLLVGRKAVSRNLLATLISATAEGGQDHKIGTPRPT